MAEDTLSKLGTNIPYFSTISRMSPISHVNWDLRFFAKPKILEWNHFLEYME